VEVLAASERLIAGHAVRGTLAFVALAAASASLTKTLRSERPMVSGRMTSHSHARAVSGLRNPGGRACAARSATMSSALLTLALLRH
jgi:hypothetical protein